MESTPQINLNNEQLNDLFSLDEKCLQILSELKWTNGFVCRKCGNKNASEGKAPFSKRCTRCKNEESATANTLFHNIKFPVNKAFYIAYNEYSNPNNISAPEYGRKLELRELTCWNFKNRVQNKIEKLKNYSLLEDVSFAELLVRDEESPFN
jgi:hypothetical protein